MNYVRYAQRKGVASVVAGAAVPRAVDSSDIVIPLVYIKMQIENECAYLIGKDLRYN